MQRPLPFFFATLCTLSLAAQTAAAQPAPRAATPHPLKLSTPRPGSYPFRAVRIDDHRPDGNLLMIKENGKFPLSTLTLSEAEVARYLGARIAKGGKNRPDLLIDLRRLSVPNDHRLGNVVFLDADTYICPPDSGCRLGRRTVRSYPVQNGRVRTICGLLDELLENAEVASLPAGRDYGIYSMPDTVRGIFTTFDDFRAGACAPWRVVLHPSGGVYRGDPDSSWGVSDGNRIFIHYRSDVYLPLVHDSAGYHFWIPPSQPDAYTLMSAQYTPRKLNYPGLITIPNDYISSLDDIWAMLALDVTVTITANAVYGLAHIRPKKHLGKADRGFRYCTIDMENGDIRYARQAYPR